MPNLTDLAIRSATPGVTLWDSSLIGFGLRAGKNARTFIVLIASGRRQTIGRYPLISLADARKEARRILAEKTLGKTRPTRVAWNDGVADFLADCQKRLRSSTLRSYRQHLDRHFPFGRQALAEITPRQILKQITPLSAGEKEHAFRVGRTFFKWCIHQHLIDRSPMENLAPPPAGVSRERVLTQDELRAVWHTARAGDSTFHRIAALLILTGQRRGEIAALEWSWIKDDTITLPAALTKNKREHVFPVGPEAEALLAAVPRLSDTYVFPALRKRNDKTTVFNGWGKPKARFDRECGVAGWCLHDIRRSVATILQQLGVRLEVTEALLNHVGGTRAGIVGIYQRHRYLAEMREAILKLEAHLTNLKPPKG